MADNTLRIGIIADTRGLNAGLSKAQTRLKAFGSKMSAVGASLQTRLALPLLAGAGASIKMAADFDKSMTKIKTLVGVAGDKVDGMSMKVKSLAQNAAIDSADAADALFFITSAGLRGSDALDVLEASTKAAALGLGDTATIADLSTSALNAYGLQNISASQATDVLTGAVREGKLEASELSSVMGQVLPVASNMGVKFHEVGAAFAAMSRTGTPAAQAATQLNGIMMAIMKPTKQSAAAMQELGLSSEGLRQQIKDKGLLSVFQTLKEKSLENSQAFEKVFGNVRALKGILDLTGASAEMTNEIFGRMANVTGMTNKAFIELQKSSEFKLRKGLIQLKNSFADVGAVLMETLLPLITNFLGFIQGLFVSFQNLDPVVQQIAIGFGLLAMAFPTILSIGGAVLTMFAAMVSPIGLIAAGVAAVALIIYKNWNEVLPVIVGLYNRFVDLYNGSENLRIAASLIKSAFQTAFIRIKQSIDQVINVFKTMWNLIKEISNKGIKGSFSDILENSFNNAVDISKKAGEEIAELFVENYEKAINNGMEKISVSGVQKGLTKVGDLVKNSFSSMFSSAGVVTPSVKAAPTADSTGDTTGDDSLADSIKDEGDKVKTAAYYTNEQLQSFTDEANDILSGGFGDMIGNISDALGQAMAGGANFAKGLEIALLGGFISIAQQLGKMAIGIGLAVGGIKKALQSLNPAVAIGAGIALLVLAGVAKGQMGKMSGGGGGVTAFANGGIVSGPTMGLMGEYSGARSNPEVIAPLDKLKGMIGDRSQNVNVGGEFRIQGQDLVVALQRAEKNRSRIL